MPTLLLVDGSSYLYRAFHALPDLRNAAGMPTGAIYGVLSMLRRLSGEFKADYLACVFDARGKTFREDWYPDYKAHRPPMPDDLSVQTEPLYATIAAQGWPVLIEPGVEADDVIGTLTHRACDRGWQVIISTGDKDLAQLVSPQVRLVDTMRNETLDEAAVNAKFGVPPALIVDLLTLTGDAVDNVPGVAKVGPKTAAKWLAQYGSLDGIIGRAQEIGGVVGENLRRALDFLPLGRRLITVATDLPLAVDPDELVRRAPDRPRLRALYAELGFRSWLGELERDGALASGNGAAAADAATAAPVQDPSASGGHRERYACITSFDELASWLARINSAERVAIDTETTSLDPMTAELVGISFAVAEGEAAYLPIGHRYPGAREQLPREAVFERLKPWLESSEAAKVGQNLKYDRHVLANCGIRLAGVRDDTLLESYVLESGQAHDLDTLARRHLGIEPITYEAVAGKGARQIGFEQVTIEQATLYSAEDADLCLRVHHRLAPRLAATPRLDEVYREIELPVAEVLFAMERHGVLIDAEALLRQSAELGRQLLELEAAAHELAGQTFNLSSPKQIQDILYARMGLPVLKKTPGGAPSTDEEVLAQLALDFPLPRRILDYRALAKLKSTYTDKLPARVNPTTGRVHTNFSQAVAVTGRLASSDPNLQNIPVRTEAGRRIRSAFIAPAGHELVSADYSQIELRVMAHLSADDRLLAAFAAGEDIHRATAAEVFGVTPDAVTNDQRRVAKVINFGLIYGMSAFGLARELGIERAAAEAYISRYFMRYPGVAAYMEHTRAAAREQGYVETVFGRRLWLADIRSAQPARRQAAERAAINAPMQGTAADLTKLAMIAVHRWLADENLSSRLILQVHDELVLEVPVAERERVLATVPRLMAGVAALSVPLEVEIGAGPNWEQAH
ncbi:MAG: DNA polymerase I [Betaproteobacteria bacterium]|nr:DNA polymerase I [Rhodocyclaceae bacterium]